METKTIETPIGKQKVELKCWLTGRDRRAIDSVFYEDVKIGMVDNKPDVDGFKGSLINKAQDRLLEVIVVSVDGVTEGCLDKVLEMREDDFNFVLKEVEEITKKKIE